ncbi:uncharacterized protein LOC120326611 [Styela clava]
MRVILFALASLLMFFGAEATGSCEDGGDGIELGESCSEEDEHCGEFIIELSDLEDGFKNKPEILEFIGKHLPEHNGGVATVSTAVTPIGGFTENNEDGAFTEPMTTEKSECVIDISPPTGNSSTGLRFPKPKQCGNCDVNMFETHIDNDYDHKNHIIEEYTYGIVIQMNILEIENVTVYCAGELFGDDKPYIVIQRRVDNTVNFDRSLDEYVAGFGDMVKGNFWLGLETIHDLTYLGKYRTLEIVLIDKDRSKDDDNIKIKFMNATVGSNSSSYRFNSGSVTPESESESELAEYFSNMKNMSFSVRNVTVNGCPESSGWWFNMDGKNKTKVSSLNGPYNGYSGLKLKTDSENWNFEKIEMRLYLQ